MKIVSVSTHKGGSGKTSHTVCIAGALAEQGRRVLVVDNDPSGHASRWLGHTGDRELLAALLTDSPLVDIVRASPVPGIDVIPTGIRYQSFEHLIATDPDAHQLALRRGLHQLPQDRWDLVLIDSQPTQGRLGVTALAAADEVLVPVEMQTMVVEGLMSLASTLDTFRQSWPWLAEITAVCPYRAETNTVLYQELHAGLVSRFGADRVFPCVRKDVRMGDANSHQLPITQLAPKSNAAKDYRTLASALAVRWFSVAHAKVDRHAAA